MRTILITGANSEIASSYINRTAKDYDRVIALYGHRNERINDLVALHGNKIVPIHIDLACKEEVDRFVLQICDYEVDEFLHLAAPKLYHMRLSKGSMEDYETEMQVISWSFLRICQALLPGMVKRKSGRILAILTEYTVSHQPPYIAHYITAKFALLGLIKCIASEYASKGIRVNGISPGMIETDFISSLPQYIIDNNSKKNISGKNLKPDDLIPTMVYLLNDDSTTVNGQNLLI